MNLVDSYQDDTGIPCVKDLETNINLDFKGFEKEHAQLSAEYELTRGSQIALVKLYTAGSEINGKLINVGGDPDELEPRYRIEYNALKSLGDMVSLSERHHVYSGTGTFNPMEVTESGIFRTPAFMSTSLSIKVAVKTTNFRRDNEDADEDHIIHLILQPGFSDGFYVAPYSHDPEELEFLIMPKSAFKHVKTQKLRLGGVMRTIHSFKPSKD